MNAWLRAALAIGVGYALVGILFALPATHALAWRWAAWAVSLIAFSGHIWFERFRLSSSPTTSALHIALAVAIGSFGMAVGANVHSLIVPSANASLLLRLSLVIWPVMTALPVFLLTFVLNLIIVRYARRPRPS